MLFYRVIHFFWSNNRATLSAYCFGSVALLIFLFIQADKLDPDFNALSLLSTLNITFVVASLLLSRQILYKFYQNKTHYFFAQLPISAVKMRLYEHLCFFILCALPYLITLPFLLFQVYFSGLWSTSQVVNFLGFQLVLWLFFANYALCIAMLGRICWYIFWGLAIGLTLYIQHNKNYQIDLMSFIDVRKVLFKTNTLTPLFVFNYLGAAIILYISAFFLSFTIDRNAFGLLHTKETRLSRGIFSLYLVSLFSSYFYFTHQLSLFKSQFEGLHLTQISLSEKDDRTEDYWSSSVQLNEQQIQHYTESIAQLNQALTDFSNHYQLTLPPVHYQHTPEQSVLTRLHKEVDPDNDLELKFNFDQISEDFYSIERDAIIEYLKILSRGWIEKENKLIYLRGLAANWSWKNKSPSLINARVKFLSSYPDFSKQYNQAQWQTIYQNSGACLFDALALTFVQKIESKIPEHDWQRFIQTGLNLDHTWVPLHMIRSVFSLAPHSEKLVDDYTNKSAIDNTRFDFLLETTVLYPTVFQVQLQTSHSQYQDILFHLYPHQTSGRQIDFQSLQDHSFSANKQSTEHVFKLPMLKNERFSATFSWHQQQLNCRVFAPWKYVTL